MKEESGSFSLPIPGVFRFSLLAQGVCLFLVAIGGVTFFYSIKIDPVRTWASFLQNHFYFMSLALGGLFFAALQWLTGAMWSAPIRRLSEALVAYLPFVLVSFWALTFGIPDLYLWSHSSQVLADPILSGKAVYLETSFFTLRNLIAIGGWLLFAFWMLRNSISQDRSKDPRLTAKNRSLCPVFMIFFAITFTMVSFDQLMSLDPHWFSTIFGVYCFSGLFYSTLASVCLLALYFRSRGWIRAFVNENHLHDLGKFMFAFTVFWAYIGFSQFMLIWYANLPEETGYYLNRLHADWKWVSFFLLVGKFLVPFLFLLPRGAKRSPRLLAAVGVFMLFAHWMDLLWLIQPEFFEGGPQLGWLELGMTLGFWGLFLFCVFQFLSRVSCVAIGDPRLSESVFHHHQ